MDSIYESTAKIKAIFLYQQKQIESLKARVRELEQQTTVQVSRRKSVRFSLPVLRKSMEMRKTSKTVGQMKEDLQGTRSKELVSFFQTVPETAPVLAVTLEEKTREITICTQSLRNGERAIQNFRIKRKDLPVMAHWCNQFNK